MKEYDCICHICGKHHTVKTDFLSTSISCEEDKVTYPVVSCGEHTQEEVKRAYERNV